MERQALEISKLGKNINIKIPITNTKGKSTNKLISKLSDKELLATLQQYLHLISLKFNENCKKDRPIILSVFAGRIADSGRDPGYHEKMFEILKKYPKAKLLWASTRGVQYFFKLIELVAILSQYQIIFQN